jgi:hypothetical protein
MRTARQEKASYQLIHVSVPYISPHNDPDDAKWVSKKLAFNPTLMQLINREY